MPKKKKFKVEIPVKAYITMEVQAENETDAKDIAIQSVEIRTIIGDNQSNNFTGVVGLENSLYIPDELQYNFEDITILED